MIIELNHISKSIKGTPILQDITLHMEGGTIYGLQGKNGSGKTMLMRAICGLITIDEGSILINGKTLHKDMDFPPSVGVLIENPAFLNRFTGFQNLRLLADLQGNITDQQIKNLLSDVGLQPDDKRTYKKYSLGMKQKLGIAAALIGYPELVILDEPINAIDENGVASVRKLLKKVKNEGKVVIIACHDNEEMQQLADVILPMEEGRLILS